MRKFMAALLLIILMNFSVYAKEFNDVPEDHWAGEAVYGIVKYGVTQGFPDGTFRGTRTINRFELSILLWNLIQATEERMKELYNSGVNAETEKLIAELRAEIADLKTELALIQVTTKETQNKEKANKPKITYIAQSEATNKFNISPKSAYFNRLIVEYSDQLSEKTDYEIKYDSEFQQTGSKGKGLFGPDLKQINARLSTRIDTAIPIWVDLTTGAGSTITRYNHFDDAITLTTAFWGFTFIQRALEDYDSSKLIFGSETTNIGTMYEKYTNTNAEKLYAFLNYEFSFAQFTFEGGYNYDKSKWFDNKLAAYQTKIAFNDIFKWGQTYDLRMTYIGKYFYTESIDGVDTNMYTPTYTIHSDIRSLYDNLNINANRTLFEFAINQNLWGWETTLLSGVEHELSKSSNETSSLYQILTETNIEKDLVDLFFDVYWKNNVNGKATDITRTGLKFTF